MSGPPPAAAGAKPVGGFSAFINKGTSNRKFAPKAARRRPGATAASTTPAPETPAVETPAVETPTESQATPQHALPTPAATQEQQPQAAPPSEQAPPESTAHSGPTPTTSKPSAPTPVERNTPSEDTRGLGSDGHTSLQRAEEEGEEDIVTEKELPAPVARDQASATGVEEAASAEAAESPAESPQEPSASQPVQDIEEVRQEDVGQSQVAVAPTPAASHARRSKRSLPWTAVNQPQQDVEQPEDEDVPIETSTDPKRNQRKRKAGGADEVEDGLQGPVTKRRRARARKVQVQPAGSDVEDDEDAFEAVEGSERPARQPPKARKAKGAPTTRTRKRREVAAAGLDEGAEQSEPEAPRPKKKRAPKRKKKATPAEGAEGLDASAEGGEENRPARSKGRVREATPSDAEDRRIEPDSAVMGALAGRSYRIGKLSEREKKMREMNWDEIERRRREQLAAKSKDSRAVNERLNAVGEALDQAQGGASGPRMVMGPDGQIVVEHGSNVIDREAEADAEIEAMVIEEEDDLTRRTTTKSFMHKRKRNPQEFMYPGQGMRWNAQATEYFYEGLETFGTDFEMIRTLFPGTPRNSIKNKFTKEERENPQRVKEALAARRNTNWNQYITRSGRQDEQFVDLDAFKKEMAEMEADAARQIEAAKAAAEEEKRQMRLAGIDVDGEGATGSSKENDKGKKRKQGTPTTPQEEKGVEIIADDDPDFW